MTGRSGRGGGKESILFTVSKGGEGLDKGLSREDVRGA